MGEGQGGGELLHPTLPRSYPAVIHEFDPWIHVSI